MKKLERIYEEIAKRHGTTAERVRRDIRSALKAAEESQELNTCSAWDRIPHSGEKPTPGEVIAYCSAEVARRLNEPEAADEPEADDNPP